MRRPLVLSASLPMLLAAAPLHAQPAQASDKGPRKVPSTAALTALRLFEEPLIPCGEPGLRENSELSAALSEYLQRNEVEDFAPFQSFLESHPASPWAASLWSNLGAAYHQFGYHGKALACWQRAWDLSRQRAKGPARAIAERSGSGLADLYARFGKREELERLLRELASQPGFRGPAGDRVARARLVLEHMRKDPDAAFSCGPVSIAGILAEKGLMAPDFSRVRATSKGTSLAQNLELAGSSGLEMQAAFRVPGAPVIVPALVHWKTGHFAALLESENGRYKVKDPTLGTDRWVSLAALEAESSGNFLIPGGSLQSGWSPLSHEQTVRVWGAGNAPDGCDSNRGPKTRSCPKPGMAEYSFLAANTGLVVEDTPMTYTPPKGPSIPITVTYMQRQQIQPQTFTFSNLGPKWTISLLSYLEDTTPSGGIVSPGAPRRALLEAGIPLAPRDVEEQALAKSALLLGKPGVGLSAKTFDQPLMLDLFGEAIDWYFGSRTYRGFPASAPDILTQDTLVHASSSSYERIDSKGTRRVYDQVTTLAPGSRRIFFSKVIDRDGNQLTINFDAQMRITTVVDALGQVTTLSYEVASDPLKITRITDPFGRFATFQYNAAGQLWKITDVVGITSEFTYGPTATSPNAPADFLNSLTTPYGTTTFDVAESYGVRQMTATDPMGNKERIESRNASTLPASEPIAPSGFMNNYLNYRNSFFWNKRAMAQYPGDYTKAEIFHWLHNAKYTSARFPILESSLKPGESRTWHAYPGQPDTLTTGSLNLPSLTARILPDGTTQKTQATYNAAGKVDTSTDALGRVTKYVYSSPDFEDLLEVRNITSGANELLSQMAYDGNHRPLTVKDAAGQTTTYTYNTAGQVATITNPLGQTTTMAYDAQGYLTSVTGAVLGSTTTFAYDAYGRVATVTGPDGNATTTEYDDLNRPTKVTYADGTYEQMVYDKLDLARSRDRKGRWTFMTYNPLRQLSEVEDAQGRITRFDWCGCGSQLEGLTDPMGRVTLWLRDLNGRVVVKVLDDQTKTSYLYDTAGRLAQRTDAKGQFTLYDYFADGALKQVSYPNAQRPTPTVSYTYDAKYSRLATMADGIGTTQYGYGPITAPPALGAGRLATVDGPWANDTITYQYDALGRVVSRDIAGSAETRGYDLLGRVSTVSNALGTFTYTYDGLTSRLKQVDYPNGQKTKYTYDGPEFRLKSIENLKSDNSNISTFGYTYDLDGQIKTWSQAADAQAPKTYTFDYDAVNQLTGAVLNGPNGELLRQYSYGYDLMGNRTSEGVDGATTTATFNNTNQLMGQRYSLNSAAIKQQEDARKAQKAKAAADKAKSDAEKAKARPSAPKTPASPAPAAH